MERYRALSDPDAHCRVRPLERPDDFDAYWDEVLDALSDIPAAVRKEPDHGAAAGASFGPPGVSVTRLCFASLGGKRPAAWFYRPEDRPPEGALVFFPGYSAACGLPLLRTVLAQLSLAGFAVLAVDPRGQGESRALHPPAPEGKIVTAAADPREYIYRGIAADCVQAVKVLQGLTGFTRVGVFGHSQGGGLALVTASLAPEAVGAVGCMIPFLTHLAWAMANRATTGPYQQVYDFVQQLAHKRPDALAQVRRSFAYIDTLHHAPRVSAPTLVSVGLRDTTCPPETVYALFSRLDCVRSLLVLPDAGHEHRPEFYHHQLAWFRHYLAPTPPECRTLESLGLT